MDIEKINRLNNEYRALIREAADLREEKGVPSREEGLCYQNASAKAGQLATMSIGAESQHWIGEQAMCSRKMREIWAYLNPEEVKPKAPATGKPAAGTAGATGDSAAAKPSPATATATEKKKKGDVPDETVARWFQEDPGYGFDKVAGMEELKELLRGCVRDVSLDSLNSYLGISTVQSFFFYGPPGCGKTFIIEAFAHELMQNGYQFMKLESADIHSKFSGEADKIVKRAFAEAVEHAPCILFMDEIDGICQSRSMPNLSDFNMTLTTTFLTSYNNLTRANKDNRSVVFIGATNYPANVDIAMLDRVELVQVPLPDEELRAYSFKQKFEPVIRLADDLTWEDMADATEGYNQRDINRVSDHLRMLIRTGVADYTSGNQAVEALKSGEFRLTKEMFEHAMSKYKPAPKDDIEKSLNEFENKMRFM